MLPEQRLSGPCERVALLGIGGLLVGEALRIATSSLPVGGLSPNSPLFLLVRRGTGL